MSEQKPETPATSTTTDGDAAASHPKAQELITAASQAASVDVTRYKTAEIKKRFQELFGFVSLLPQALLGLSICTFGSFLLWVVLFVPRAPIFITIVALIYMALQGFYLGILAAGLLVVARVLQKLTAIIDITIQTLREMFKDLNKVRDPEVRAELAGGLIHGAIIPSVQSVITVKMGLLRAPIGWVLNRILGTTAKKLTSSMRTKLMDTDKTDAPSQPPATIADDDDSGDGHLDRIQERVEVIARRTRRATLIPATIFFVGVAIVSSIPWFIAVLFIF